MLPLPSRSHPQKQNLVVYTKELTHLLGRLHSFAYMRTRANGSTPVDLI
jgi:hypothetical protein